MALFLEITTGTQKGNRTRLTHGLVIGRRDGDLTIRDSKLSSRHAQVEERPNAGFWLVDLGSANGIKTSEGGRVRELELTPGSVFTLGRTEIRVVATEDLALANEGATSAAAHTVTRTYWDNVRELAEKALNKTRTDSQASRREVTAFAPLVRLKFTQGLQAGTEWTVGYGPRMIGSGSIDLHLEDPSLPAVCFRLLPEDGGQTVRFKNESEREVKLNGQWVQEEVLKNGDVIDIVTTQIQVIFDEGS